MPATVKATLKAPDKAGKEHHVRIRVYTEQPAKYYDTGIKLMKKHWNKNATYEKTNWIKDSYQQFRHVNEAIKTFLDDFKQIVLKNPHASASEIIRLYKNPPQNNQQKGFFAYFEEFIQRKKDLGQIDVAYFYDSILKRVKKFTGEKPDEAKFLTLKQATRFKEFLEGNNPEKIRNAASTINGTFGALRLIYKEAVFEGWVPMVGQPFRVSPSIDIDIEKPRPTTDHILTLATIEPPTREQLDARNISLMFYFLGGARVGETIKLEWEKNVKPEYIQYLPGKRSKKTKRIQRHAGIEWVLSQYPRQGNSKYVFPYLTDGDEKRPKEEFRKVIQSCIGSINTQLKKLAIAGKIPIKLSTRMFRRAYIDAADDESGDIRLTQKGVGHSSVAVTEVYRKDPVQEEIDKMNTAVYKEFEKLEIPGKHQANNIEIPKDSPLNYRKRKRFKQR